MNTFVAGGACGAFAVASLEGEHWRTLLTYQKGKATRQPDYLVSNLGRVARVNVQYGQGQKHTGSYLLSPVWRNGTLCVYLLGRYWTLAQLVAYAWVGEPPIPTAHIGHRDGDRENFRPDNLEWRTWRRGITWRHERKWQERPWPNPTSS